MFPKKKNKLLILILVTALTLYPILSIPMDRVYAASNFTAGDFVITAENQSDYSYTPAGPDYKLQYWNTGNYKSNGVLTILKSGTYSISMKSGVQVTTDRIKVNPGLNVTLTINGLNIAPNPTDGYSDHYGQGRPFDMSGATVTLNVQGNNTFRAPAFSTALFCPANSNLTVKGTGTLNAIIEGKDYAVAAIGGEGKNNPMYTKDGYGSEIISGQDQLARVRIWPDDNDSRCGNITFDGSMTVNAKVRVGEPAKSPNGEGEEVPYWNIGQPDQSNELCVFNPAMLKWVRQGLNGPEEVDTSLAFGYYSSDCAVVAIGGAYDGNITIKNGKIDAKAGCLGTGIGSVNRTFGKITIDGGTVNAKSGYATDHSPSTDYVGFVDYGPAIGWVHYGDSQPSNMAIEINGGTVTAVSGYGAAGIGGGIDSTGGTIKITGGTVNATGGDNGAGIGGGIGQSVKGSTTDQAKIIITGGNITASGGINAAGIGGGGNNLGSGVTAGHSGDILIGGNATVRASGGTNAPGIGAGGSGTDNPYTNACGVQSIVITTTGTVTATAGSNSPTNIGSGKVIGLNEEKRYENSTIVNLSGTNISGSTTNMPNLITIDRNTGNIVIKGDVDLTSGAYEGDIGVQVTEDIKNYLNNHPNAKIVSDGSGESSLSLSVENNSDLDLIKSKMDGTGGSISVNGSEPTYTPVDVVVQANNITINTGDSLPNFTYNVTGLKDGDRLTGTVQVTCPTANTSRVGTYDIIVSGGSVPNNGKYNSTIIYQKGTLTVRHTHNYETVYTVDASAHWHRCTAIDCNLQKESLPGYGTHNFVENATTENFVRRYENVGETVKKQMAVYYKSCSVCGKKSTETFEVTESEEQIITHTHNFATTFTTNESAHWYRCIASGCTLSLSEQKDYGAHIFKEVPSESYYVRNYSNIIGNYEYYTEVYYKSCNVCGRKSTETFEVTISRPIPDIGEPPVLHEYETTYSTNSTHHWFNCKDTNCNLDISEMNGYGAHTFVENVSKEFFVREYTNTINGVTYVTSVYYKSCGICEKKSTETFETTISSSNPDIGEPPVLHEYETTYSTNGTHHWYNCKDHACTLNISEMQGYEAHTFAEIKNSNTFVRKYETNGTGGDTARYEVSEYYKSCNVCGRISTEKFETRTKIGDSGTTGGNTDSGNTDTGNADSGNTGTDSGDTDSIGGEGTSGNNTSQGSSSSAGNSSSTGTSSGNATDNSTAANNSADSSNTQTAVLTEKKEETVSATVASNTAKSTNRATATVNKQTSDVSKSLISILNNTAENSVLESSYPPGDIITSDILKILNEKNINLKIREAGKPTWDIKGYDMKNPENEIKLGIEVFILDDIENKVLKGKIKDLVPNKKVVVANFAHSGNLPGKINVSVQLTSNQLKYLKTKTVSIYHIDEENNKLELIKKDAAVLPTSYISFEIEKCSPYVFVNEEEIVMPEESEDFSEEIKELELGSIEGTGSPIFFYILMAILFAGVIGGIVYIRKEFK